MSMSTGKAELGNDLKVLIETTASLVSKMEQGGSRSRLELVNAIVRRNSILFEKLESSPSSDEEEAAIIEEINANLQQIAISFRCFD